MTALERAGSSIGRRSTLNDSQRRVLIDTNVLFSAVDRREQSKSRTANAIVSLLIDAGVGVITTQVVAEYFDATTRPRGTQPPIHSRQEAERAIDLLLGVLDCLPMTESLVRDAMRIAGRHQMRIYDAQLIAVAKDSGIAIILTEDLQSARVIEGVRYVDPFAPAFRPALVGL